MFERRIHRLSPTRHPERRGLFFGCHGHGFAWPCFSRSADTATQSRDRGTHLSTIRCGFTLVELLVVIGLLVLIAVMTASAINLTISGDKVRGASRQVQSYLSGARDRAIYSKAPRGVRFLLDPTNNRTVSSMVYIAPTEDWTQGTIQMEWDNSNIVTVVRGFDDPANNFVTNPTDWPNLYKQGLLKDGARIRIPNDNTGEWYTIDTSMLAGGATTNPRLLLTTAYGKAGTTTSGPMTAAFQPGQGPSTYKLELPPSVLPNQEPVLLPKGAVIHLDRCSDNVEQQPDANNSASERGNKLPDAWIVRGAPLSVSANSGFVYSSQMDVMFSPRGVVIGPAAQRGLIQLYICDQKDADRDRLEWSSPSFYSNGPAMATTVSVPEYEPRTAGPNDGITRGDKVITALFTRTGAVSSHQVHPAADLVNPNYVAPTPYPPPATTPPYTVRFPPALREYERFKFAETGEGAGK